MTIKAPVTPATAAGVETQHQKKIIRLLERVTASGRRPSQIFEDWIAWTEVILAAVPHAFVAALEGKAYQETAEQRQAKERLSAIYRPEYLALLEQATETLIRASATGWMDLVGNIYMEWGWPSKGRGQFFTPWPVAEMMARMMNGNDGEVGRRLEAAIEQSIPAQAQAFASLVYAGDPDLHRTYIIARVLPHVMAHYDPPEVNDPAVGSGIMLLAYASQLPWWHVKCGLVSFTGQDIDPLCVRLCRVNCMLYGLNGHHWPMVLAEMERKLASAGAGSGREPAAPAHNNNGAGGLIGEISPDQPAGPFIQLPLFGGRPLRERGRAYAYSAYGG